MNHFHSTHYHWAGPCSTVLGVFPSDSLSTCQCTSHRMCTWHHWEYYELSHGLRNSLVHQRTPLLSGKERHNELLNIHVVCGVHVILLSAMVNVSQRHKNFLADQLLCLCSPCYVTALACECRGELRLPL